MTTTSTLLDDRSVVKVAGEDATTFLHGLVTNDIETLAIREARFAALLTPQGKILFDFFIYHAPDEAGPVFLIDCPASATADLAKRLGFYRLRAKVTIADASADYRIAAFWDDAPEAAAGGFVYADPRDPRLGFRAILPRVAADGLGQAVSDYEARRIAAAAPKGGVDFAYGDAFPHDVNMDLLHGVDFEKGCFVGQEVVSRMRHRGGARKRMVKVTLAAAAPKAGAAIMAGEVAVGALGSSSGHQALALVRLDRLADAKADGRDLTADGVRLIVDDNEPAFLA
ncbi:MAG TPA: folate-binding protein [Roseiarcus sp.]|nr:folate-binding protein [Roseiarcus sp.]